MPKEDKVVFYAGALYKTIDVHGRTHHALCLDACEDGLKRLGFFHLRGFSPEAVEEGSERATQFKMVYKPK